MVSILQNIVPGDNYNKNTDWKYMFGKKEKYLLNQNSLLQNSKRKLQHTKKKNVCKRPFRLYGHYQAYYFRSFFFVMEHFMEYSII